MLFIVISTTTHRLHPQSKSTSFSAIVAAAIAVPTVNPIVVVTCLCFYPFHCSPQHRLFPSIVSSYSQHNILFKFLALDKIAQNRHRYAPFGPYNPYWISSTGIHDIPSNTVLGAGVELTPILLENFLFFCENNPTSPD